MIQRNTSVAVWCMTCLAGYFSVSLFVSESVARQTSPQTSPASEKNPKATVPASKPAVPPAAKPMIDAVIPADRSGEKWWTPLHESFNARAKQGAEHGDIGIIFLGDSITMQWAKAGGKVWEEFYGKRQAVNFGIGGDRTQHVIWRLDHGNVEGLASPKKGDAPKLLVLMIGTNNSGSNTAEEIAEGIKATVLKVREKLPTTKVLLLGIFPREQRPNVTREHIQTASRLAKGVADGQMVHYLDIGSSFMEPDGSIKPEVMPDFIHLSEEGYRRWAAAIEPKVKELLGDTDRKDASSGQNEKNGQGVTAPSTSAPATAPRK